MSVNFAFKLPDHDDKPRLAMTRPEFSGLDFRTVMAALTPDAENAIYAEVQRLVDDYAVALRCYWDNNGNTLPAGIQVSAMRPIEKIAMDLAAKGMEKKLKYQGKVSKH